MRSYDPGEPLLTVVVPVYRMAGRLTNFRRWIGEIDENLVQVLLIHDGPNKETSNELREILSDSEKYRIEIIEVSVGSPGLARNEGLYRAKGRWVIFWDSDDLPIVKNVMEILDEVDGSVEIICGCFETINAINGTTSVIEYHENDSLDVKLSKISMQPGIWRFIFRIDVLKGMEFEGMKLAEDQIFLLDSKLLNRKVLFTNKVFYKYFIGDFLQITNDKSLISELRYSWQAIFRRTKEYEGDRSFHMMLLIKLCLTLFKRGSLSLRVFTIFSSIKMFVQYPVVMAKTLLTLGKYGKEMTYD